MKIVSAGEGAFGVKHLEAIQKIEGVEVVSIAGGLAKATKAVAERFKIPCWSADLAESLTQPGVGPAILTAPKPINAAQGLQCRDAGNHVMIEIPMADNLADAERLVAKRREAGLVAMCSHTRRFNPRHHWIRAGLSGGSPCF